MFIPHEEFTPQKYVHSSMWGSAEGGTPSAGSGGAIPPAGGFKGKHPSMGIQGQSPRRKNFLVNVYCNFIVNLDRSL
jgi:hypothetical protein